MLPAMRGKEVPHCARTKRVLQSKHVRSQCHPSREDARRQQSGRKRAPAGPGGRPSLFHSLFPFEEKVSEESWADDGEARVGESEKWPCCSPPPHPTRSLARSSLSRGAENEIKCHAAFAYSTAPKWVWLALSASRVGPLGAIGLPSCRRSSTSPRSLRPTYRLKGDRQERPNPLRSLLSDLFPPSLASLRTSPSSYLTRCQGGSGTQ